MKKKTKTYKWDTKITQAIRKVWRYSPERKAAIDKARDPFEKKLVKCAGCLDYFNEKLIAVDHIEPVVPITGFISWDDFIAKMQHNSLQILCEDCHKLKTKEESGKRAAARKLIKPLKSKRNKK